MKQKFIRGLHVRGSRAGKKRRRRKVRIFFGFVPEFQAYWVSELSKQLHENGGKASSGKKTVDDTKVQSSNINIG
jgi:hypothetical protein